MDDYEVCKMRPVLVRQHISPGTEDGIHMPPLRQQRKRWKTAAQILKKLLEELAVLMVKSMVAVCAGWIISLWAIPAAQAERGYAAIGGEWMLILFVVGFVYWLVSKRFDIQPKGK